MASIRHTRKRAKPIKPVSEKQHAEDEGLREELRQFDVKKFDKLLERAIKSNVKKKDG